MKKLLLVFVGILSLSMLPALFIGLLFVSWSTTYTFLPWVFVILLILLYTYVWRILLRWFREKQPMKKKQHVGYWLGILICTFIIMIVYTFDHYEKSFGRVEGEVELYSYEPFKENRLPLLDETPTLQMQSPLPRLDGATALYPLYAAIVQNLYPEGEYSPHTSDVSCNTTPIAYEMLLRKEKDIIFVAGPSKNQEKMFQDRGEEMVLTPIGKESFVFFVNANNPIDALSIKQITDIYSGEITNWKEVGGNDEDIRAFQRPAESGSQSALLKLMGDNEIMEPIEEDVVEGMGGIISQTASYQNRDNAIGYSFRFFTEEMVKNKEIKLLKIEGREPTIENIRKDTYPITSAFYAIQLKSNQDEQSKQLLEWLTSPQGKELIEKSGYVAY